MIKFYLITLLILVCIAGTVKGQIVLSDNDIALLTEKTHLITDRDVYCVDETILFSAFNISSVDLEKSGWSNVIYVELVAPDGESIARKKYAYNENEAAGRLEIPTWVLTGNYYLRAYTRWMRDYSPYNYFYKMVKIINPFRAELLEPNDNHKKREQDVRQNLVVSNNLGITLQKRSYFKREQASVTVTSKDKSEGKLVVSVVPEGLENSLKPDLSVLKKMSFTPDFIPETRGLSVSGKVVNELDSVPLPYTLVGLTIFKENPENLNVLTNDQGQFFFDLAKLEGAYEIFISAKTDGKKKPLILVDNDFSVQQVQLPFVSVDLSEQARKQYQSLAINSQIHKLYKQQQVQDEIKSFSSDSAFYGSPDFTLQLDQFIDLPTVKDYIYELIPQVGVRHDDKRTVLRVLGDYSELGIYDPLILVDMVPVFDVDKVLVLQPGKIDRIEVVTTPYVRGDIIFGGIVSLFSKKADLAGIDLPSAGRFITYNMLSKDTDMHISRPENSRIPNLSNCIYWNADLKLGANNAATISFNTGDTAGNFVIVVHSIDSRGNEKMATAKFVVE